MSILKGGDDMIDRDAVRFQKMSGNRSLMIVNVVRAE